jgi:hypothetical protein
MKTAKMLAVVAGLAFAATAQAQVWTEVGDAMDLTPGQITVGSGPLTQIDGGLTANDVDLFCIFITDPANFSATTIGGATFDTQLWLFRPNGLGVTANDDAGGGVQSRITGQFVTSPGVYALGISRFNRDAVDAGGQLIWNSTPFGTERAPDGPGAANPLAGWLGATAGPVPYSIFITGATFWVPAPGSVALLGLAGLAASRRRR